MSILFMFEWCCRVDTHSQLQDLIFLMKLEVPDGEPIGGVPVLLTERHFPSLVRVQVDDILRASSVVQPLAWLLARLLHV